MKNILGTCLSGLAVALLLVVGGAAQENVVIGGVAGVRGLHGHPVLPPAVIFSNCGSGCTSYNNSAGYYISGTALAAAPGQTLAMGFTPKNSSTFSFALTPNAVFTDNGGASSGRLSAFLLHGSASKGPTTFLAKLTQHGTIPDFPSVKIIRWTSTKTVILKQGSLTSYVRQSRLPTSRCSGWLPIAIPRVRSGSRNTVPALPKA